MQVTDANGAVTFNTVFPGRYQGRAAHIHFEVYEDDTFSNLLLTSQVGFDDEESDAIYATDSNYAGSLRNPTYNARDNIFNDGDGSQIIEIGAPTDTLEASVVVGVLARPILDVQLARVLWVSDDGREHADGGSDDR